MAIEHVTIEMSQYDPTVRTLQPDIDLEFNPQGQMFASRETIRAAIFDVVDARNIIDLWEGDMNGYGVSEEQANVSRSRFVDAVIKRIAELQAPPHDGIKLENLCPRHIKAALPVPSVGVCVQCRGEEKRD